MGEWAKIFDVPSIGQVLVTVEYDEDNPNSDGYEDFVKLEARPYHTVTSRVWFSSETAAEDFFRQIAIDDVRNLFANILNTTTQKEST